MRMNFFSASGRILQIRRRIYCGRNFFRPIFGGCKKYSADRDIRRRLGGVQGAAKKNVPRQKLRFLKNRSVNLHVIFTHCKERICTYLDNM